MNEQMTTMWTHGRDEKRRRMEAVRHLTSGIVLDRKNIVEALELLIKPGDRVILEGDNQKQADFLAEALANVDPGKVSKLHMIIVSVSLPEHLDIFEKGIAERLEFSFAGPQSLRISQMLEDGKVHIGGIHTYLELYARLFVDLTPQVALIVADKADRAGNLYTGPNTEDTAAILEATAFKDGIVLAQVNEIVDELPRVDIPASWVDLVVESDRHYHLEPLFTRDPKAITQLQVLIAMLTIRGVYEKHGVKTLNHGIGFNAAAIELLLPTYGERLGLKGKIAEHFVLNPHPTLIPAIESGWVKTVHCFGGELGMEKYTAARPDVFFTGRDGSLRSNRAFAQVAGQYAIDMFVGSTLQMDKDANSSTVTVGRLAGFGGAPNMGHDPHGRRHTSPAWLNMITSKDEIVRGRKLVVQTVETFAKGNTPVFVERLDAVEVGKKAGLAIAPVMIYGDDVTHVVTEEGVAYLYKAQGLEERRKALAAVAGVTPVGISSDPADVKSLRERGIVAHPGDLGIQPNEASRTLLAAKNVKELVEWSGGLYDAPEQFRNW